ncbi:NAD-dependent epimerase/dehydratase family protein [Fusibacillus kribbianus]|uniref:NAD(P)-dependent oxidoreductase n=1 Tax=Fusibacillus kribbianus TaxID=3044208 RepID=A0AAP4F070_9FIRM|nr:NAD(P)-dependent oxidoreductase [Ruminococcus sp. YH-rum2234]MDI9242905.1 NAD(P)-dependent oxidoreductase [Ruminococcus sp. YH-rum2234]
MKRRTVLVTGANGYIGRHVVKALLDMGNRVIADDLVLDGIDERAEKISVPIFSGDKNIYEQLGSPDVVIHMAWRNGFVHNADSHIEDLPLHYNFIKNLLEGGLKHIAVMGTMHEIGYWEGAIDENTPANPGSLYGMSKNVLRQITLQLAKEHEAICYWIRAYYILGDDIKSHSIFTKIAQMEKEGKETFPFTSGKNKYDFIHVTQLADQIAHVVNQDEVDGIINCCSGNPISLADKVEEYIKENHYRIRPQYGAFPDRPYDSPGVWGDAQKIKKIMG